MSNESNEILISVAVRAYNMEKYIKKCLDSILAQTTDLFSLEIVISTDCCKDNTKNIVTEYIEKFGEGKIRDVTPNRNLGGFDCLFYVISQCHGKYIALCDGDDYWIDSNKLSKQFTIMENNINFSACFHNARIEYEVDSSRTYEGKVSNKKYESNEIVKSWIVPTSSFLFRSEFKNQFPPKDGFYFDDIIVFLTMAACGDVYGMCETMSVYRKTCQSWTETMERSKKTYDTLYLHYCAIQRSFNQISKVVIWRLKLKNRLLKYLFILKQSNKGT